MSKELGGGVGYRVVRFDGGDQARQQLRLRHSIRGIKVNIYVLASVLKSCALKELIDSNSSKTISCSHKTISAVTNYHQYAVSITPLVGKWLP